jgi:hypothetical protein
MRKNLFLAPLCVFLLFSFADGSRNLTGRWRVAYGNKISGEMVMQSNGHFVATFTGQTWKVGGQYKVDGNTIAIEDSTCGFGYWGKYQATWYSNDSVKINAMEDSCSGRRLNGDGAVLVRVKK